ncbi:hypothetical protein LK09_00855 [Microbacterium mangrovi]|uniref:Uncharacterized protein n=1 Tax=Microbacterium mangrovi TaxID=1348253 RepID=A0A0B2A8N8_9MICO|nr:hypothetical protein LK09_00855 [Microbacterium mangrovi]
MWPAIRLNAALSLSETAAVLVGATALWLNPTGATLAHPDSVGVTEFLLATGLLLGIRGVSVTSAPPPRWDTVAGIRLPHGETVAYQAIRDVAMVVLAAVAMLSDSYFFQWVMAFGVMFWATLGSVELLLSVFVRRNSAGIAMRALTVVAGLIGLVLLQGVHQWSPALLGSVAILVLASACLGLVLSFWFLVVVRAPRRGSNAT